MQQIIIASEEDQSTISNRLLILQKCEEMLRCAIKMKIDTISSALHKIEDEQSSCVFTKDTIIDNISKMGK